MFKHIAVGSDGSPAGRDAVALGEAVAAATGARLSLVGVFPPSFLPIPGMTDRKTMRAQVTRMLREERDQLAPDASVHTVADSSAARALRHYARRAHADLVVVGSSHSAEPGHVKVGRTGRQLLYDAPFALALAAHGLHERTPKLRKVGVGFDGCPEAEAALPIAAELAQEAHAKLLVRSVVEDRVPVLSGEAWIGLGDWSHEQVWLEARDSAQAEAQEAVARLDLPAEVSATLGDPGYEMRAFSNTVDLVVVGSRRWGPVARLVTGGVGETLVTDAGCSVLIVRRPAASRRGRNAAGREARRPAVA